MQPAIRDLPSLLRGLLRLWSRCMFCSLARLSRPRSECPAKVTIQHVRVTQAKTTQGPFVTVRSFLGNVMKDKFSFLASPLPKAPTLSESGWLPETALSAVTACVGAADRFQLPHLSPRFRKGSDRLLRRVEQTNTRQLRKAVLRVRRPVRREREEPPPGSQARHIQRQLRRVEPLVWLPAAAQFHHRHGGRKWLPVLRLQTRGDRVDSVLYSRLFSNSLNWRKVYRLLASFIHSFLMSEAWCVSPFTYHLQY